MDCRPHSVAFRKVLLLLCALLATWVTPSCGTTTKYPKALELCHSRSTSWVLCPIGPTMRVVTQSSEIAASCRLLASYFCKGAHRTGSRCPVEGTHRPGSRCRYTGAHKPGLVPGATGTRRPSSRCVPIGARGSRHASAFGSRRLLTGARRPESSYTGAHRPGLRRTGARRPGSSCVLTGAHRPGSSCTGTCKCLQAQLQMHGCQQAIFTLLVNCRAGPVPSPGRVPDRKKPSLLFTCLPGLMVRGFQLCPLELGEAARMFTLFHSKC